MQLHDTRLHRICMVSVSRGEGGHTIPGLSNFDDFPIPLYLDVSYHHTEFCFIIYNDFWGNIRIRF